MSERGAGGEEDSGWLRYGEKERERKRLKTVFTYDVYLDVGCVH